MALVESQEVSLKIGTETSGQSDVSALVESIEALAREGGAAAPKLADLAAELRSISSQTDAVGQFSALRNETTQLAGALEEAESSTAGLLNRLGYVTQATVEAGEAQAAASAKLAEARVSNDALKRSISAAAEELHQLEMQAKASGGMREIAAQTDEATRATMTWREFVATRMGPLMREFAAESVSHGEAHTRAIRQIAAEWKEYKETAGASLKTVSGDVGQSGAAIGQYAEQIAAVKQRLSQYKIDAQAAGEAVKTLTAEHKGSVAALREAEATERKLTAEYERSATQTKRLSVEIEEKNRALIASRAALEAAGVDTAQLGAAQRKLADDLAGTKAAINAQVAALREAAQARAQDLRAQAAEEQRLADIVSATKAKMAQAAQEQLAAEKRTYAEATAAAKRYDEQTRAIAAGVDRAFSSIGIRGAKAIQAEMLGIEQSLQRLATDAKVSGAEFDRAWAAGQNRVAALKREMSGAMDPFTASVGRAGSGVDGLMTKLRPLAGALAAAFSVQQGVDSLIRANVQAERLARSLATIATPALSAREQLGWLRELADRNGVAFDRMAQGFTSFAASTRDTTLEGEKTRAVFDAIVTSMGRMGRSSEEVERALQAVSQIASKGTVSMEELRGQLSEAMPGALQTLARGLGISTEQLIKMTSEGRLLAEDALPALQRELKKTIDATSDERVSGMEAGWNRLRNAITRAMDAGQERRNSQGDFLGWLAQGVDGLTDRGLSFENSWNAMLRAIEKGNWDVYTAAVDAHAEATRVAADKAALAAEQQRILGNAAAKSGAQAQESGVQWTSLDNAYSQIITRVREQIELAEKHTIARQAEGAASVALAQAFGVESEQREASLSAAAGNAVALKELALQRQTEVAVLKAELAAKQAYVATTGDESKAHKEAIANLQQTVAAREADADRATAQAQASRIAAEAARAEADAAADNSQRVGELRRAYEDARSTLESVRVAREAGKASADALTEAELAAGRAAYVYRDALNDQAAAIQANLSVKQAQNTLDQTNVQLAISVAQRAYELAKAKGDEKTATEELLRMKRLEVDVAELQAKALQAQAEAELEAIKNKREQAQASGTLTAQLKAELKAEQLAAEAKLVQGKISEEVAGKLRDLAAAAEKSGTAIEGSMTGAAAATARVGEAAARAASSFWDMSEAAKAAESETARLKRWEAEGAAARQSRSAGGQDPFTAAMQRGMDVEPADAEDLRTAFSALWNAKLAQVRGTFNADAMFDLVLREAVDSVTRNGRETDRTADVSRSAQSAPTGATPAAVYRVEISFDGRTTRIDTASAGDAQALNGLLKEFESAMARAS